MICEQCGEEAQTVRLKHAGLCDDCARQTLREELTEILGYMPCGRLLTLPHGPAICVVAANVEHKHDWG